MSYHGKLQTLKNGAADKEIQHWAYLQLEKELTLTDEEIIEFIKGWEGLVVTKRTMEMLKAILRKAQEK